MQSTNAKLLLASDTSVTAQIAITRDDNGNQTWTVWGGNMGLQFNAGSWTYRGGQNNDLLLLDGDGNSYAAVLSSMPSDFFKAFCTKTLTGWGSLNDDSLSTIQWVIWTGCV
jgi:hypothetical protein